MENILLSTGGQGVQLATATNYVHLGARDILAETIVLQSFDGNTGYASQSGVGPGLRSVLALLA